MTSNFYTLHIMHTLIFFISAVFRRFQTMSRSKNLNGFLQIQVEGYSWNSPRPPFISSGSPKNPCWDAFTFLANVSHGNFLRLRNKALSFFTFGRMVLLCPMYLLLKNTQERKSIPESKNSEITWGHFGYFREVKWPNQTNLIYLYLEVGYESMDKE